MTRLILTILAIISASIHMFGEYQGPDYLIFIFKPLTMVFIILIAVLAKDPPSGRYKIAIIAGLIFSMIGDVLLSLPMDVFVIGVFSFLIAQLIYTYAFRVGRSFRLRFLARLPFAVYGILIFVILLPGLNAMTLPVAAYVIVIMVMAWQAWDQWDDKRTQWALLAFIGAVLFVVSDSLLAINKFGEPFLAARALTLTTYFSAQWLIANSNYTQQR
jgi:uncharacterized membrane protein YhhN